MARLDLTYHDAGSIAVAGPAERYFELGLACATGKNGAIDKVAAHKWFNIAASKGFGPTAIHWVKIAAMLAKTELRRPFATRERE
ncbi:hypothetical protein B7H23_14775 [Notoacmeibacter marinus]|uniref:Sel1 repeat family protein n=1 Tax=Notoacmeibacter marinus TaxID=1876515 RepID=A0A231UU01_9HYPH|nr:hypothetical protein [Notoacmeibacter marinus]OXS99418.1 hypothetical protein B7H23_14775 [Notoacmeibacter marinus]